MTRDETKIILNLITSVYQQFNADKSVIDIWHYALRDIEYKNCCSYLNDYIQTEGKYPVPADILSRHRMHIVRLDTADKIDFAISCGICMDKGFILEKRDTYEFLLHCICEAGKKYKHDGRLHNSEYYTKSVSERFDVAELINHNAENSKKSGYEAVKQMRFAEHEMER